MVIEEILLERRHDYNFKRRRRRKLCREVNRLGG